MTHRFLHSSDLHLGKAFGGFPEAIRNRLREARHGAIGKLAATARGQGADLVLLAGDTFDAETPAPDTLRHALRSLAEAEDITWALIPGNHDSLAASELWRRVDKDAPANLRVFTEPQAHEIRPGLWILPAPCTQRRPGRDLTEAMSQPTPEGVLRVGLGHGAVTDFSGEEGSSGIIPPDRATRSGLNYLALGDWHGSLQVGPATWYSGTPECDSFKHAKPATANLINLDDRAARVDLLATGSFGWLRPEVDLVPGDDPLARLTDMLPPAAGRRNLLVELVVRGRLSLTDLANLRLAIEAAAPDFGWFSSDLSKLGAETRREDLDQIDHTGALRQAAEALLAESVDSAQTAEVRAVAAAALAHLYSLALEVQL